MILRNERTTLGWACALSGAALIAALVSQHLFEMLPCAWCVLQRLLFLIIFLVTGLALVVKVPAKVPFVLVIIASLTGIAAAIHQQTVASKALSCDLTLADRLITGSGLDSVAPWFFGVYASCFDAAVTLLGVPYAVWSLLLFVLLATLATLSLFFKNRWLRTQD